MALIQFILFYYKTHNAEWQSDCKWLYKMALYGGSYMCAAFESKTNLLMGTIKYIVLYCTKTELTALGHWHRTITPPVKACPHRHKQPGSTLLVLLV